ncbi:Put7p ASCRUDRAFT_28620, partial [Ascoidea rubescens DSM 1968]
LDTNEMFETLKSSGLTSDQSDIILNLIKSQIISNWKKKVDEFVPKTDLENEHYLFEAARAELRVEINSSRDSHLHELINGLNFLQRDSNLVHNELNQHYIKSKNKVVILVNNYKNENSLLQKEIKNLILDLATKINSKLISEFKFNAESLRWAFTRRGIFSILLVAVS